MCSTIRKNITVSIDPIAYCSIIDCWIAPRDLSAHPTVGGHGAPGRRSGVRVSGVTSSSPTALAFSAPPDCYHPATMRG